MNILVTGAAGFAGRNLTENLKAVRDGKNREKQNLRIDEIYEYDLKNTREELDEWCRKADFVFHLAGVHRSEDPAGIQAGNTGAASALIACLEKHKNRCPVMFASSVQADLTGRYEDSVYGRAKRDCEELFFRHGKKSGAPVYVYRFPHLAGKWARPDYNSAVATFCYRIAHDLPFTVYEPDREIELLFIDDLIEEMFCVLEGHPHPGPGRFYSVPVTHKATLENIASLLCTFHDQPRSLWMSRMAEDSLEKKLCSVYVSYLPAKQAVYDFPVIQDERGSFAELMKTADHGQFSVNVCRPGAVKGLHWHNSKWELFIVVAGHGLIRQRRIGTDETDVYEVSGDRIRAVYMIPGCTHSIQNLSATENLVTLMWSNEVFDPERPDTYAEPV